MKNAGSGAITTNKTKPMAITTKAMIRSEPQHQHASAMTVLANRIQVEPSKLTTALRETVFKGATDSELLALVVVSNEYGFNPFLREIYAFPRKGGGIQPVVGIDGWVRVVNRQEKYDGCKFNWTFDEAGQPLDCTCIMKVKGRSEPVEVTEFFSECKRETDPWRSMPRRMLRHKAFIQAARLAFGISGIQDEDEARDSGLKVADVIEESTIPRGRVGRPRKEPQTETEPEAPAESFLKPPTTEAAPELEASGNQVELSPAQKALCEFLTDAGVSFNDFAGWCASTGRDKNSDTWSGWEAVPEALCQSLQTDAAGLAKCVKLFGGQAQ